MIRYFLWKYDMQGLSSWIIEETETSNLGDKRLNKRFGAILSNFADKPMSSIPNTFKSWGETIAAYRFFNQEKVTPNEILSSHFDATLERIKAEKTILILQDTTEISFNDRKPIKGMGYLNGEERQGFYLHPSIAITPEKLCLGVIDAQSWSREKLGSRKNAHYQKKPIEEKESYCWIKGYEAANAVALQSPDTTVVSVTDRAGDMYELLEKLPSTTNKAFWLVRCKYNRFLLNDDDKLQLRLWDQVRESKPIGEIHFNLPSGKIYKRGKAAARPARTERLVKQEVRVQKVNLKPAQKKDGKKLASITINVVHCREINPPNEEDGIEWFLLTSLPIDNADKAIEIVQWYLARWQIELFFNVLKNGCKIEELQFESLKATNNCIAVYMIVAWRLLYLTKLGRECPDIDCNLVFEDSEWRSVYTIVTKRKSPEKAPKLNEIILMIAKLGGFLGRKSDGFPGSKVIWIGMQRMKDFSLAWEIFHSVGAETYV